MLVLRRQLILWFVFALSVGVVSATFAESSRESVKQGNKSFQKGKYDEALAAYEKASQKAPDSPYVFFNKGAALYKKGDYQKAAHFFKKAAQKSKDVQLEAQSEFNLGNSLFKASEKDQQHDLNKSLDTLKQSISHYQKSLKLDPREGNAAYNLEVSRLRMKQLLSEMKKQEDKKQKQQEEQQENKETLDELIKQQQELAQASEELAQEKSKGQDINAQAEELAKKQDELKQKTEKLKEQIPPHEGEETSPSESAKEHLNEAAQAQEVAENELQKTAPAKAKEAQKKATEEMEKALSALKGEDGQPDDKKEQEGENSEQQQQQQTAEQQENEPQEMTESKDEDAHDILSKERQDREKRTTDKLYLIQPVERDW